jgi:hypothetical protein
MTPKLSQFLNRAVLVSIPALFNDGRCRAFTLVGVELHGLWLQSDDLSERLLHGEMKALATTGPIAFVPFAQIAGVLFPTRRPSAPPATDAPAKAVASPASGAAKTTRGKAAQSKSG